jgi:hypothetical protein
LLDSPHTIAVMAYTHEETIGKEYEKGNGADRVEFVKKDDVETSSEGSDDEKVSDDANASLVDDLYQNHGPHRHGIPRSWTFEQRQ